MRWALFQQIMQKLVTVRGLDPQRDAAPYAEQLLAMHPDLFARIDGGAQSVKARLIARTIAVDHLTEVCRLPDYVDEIERSLAIATMSAGTRLVRVAALAYMLCNHDLHRDRLPAGYGLVDDCIAMRGAILATPQRHARGLGQFILGELLRIRYLGMALPSEVLGATEAVLTFSAQLAAQTRGMPNHIVERAIRDLVQNPPTSFPEQMQLPPTDDAIEMEAVLRLLPAELLEIDGDNLLFGFPDGSRLRRGAQGVLHDA